MTATLDPFAGMHAALKRANHFCGKPVRCAEFGGDWFGMIPRGRFAFAENFWQMRPDRKDYLGRLFWLDALAASINRYIDANRVEGDAGFRAVLRWYQQELFFSVDHLRGGKGSKR
ncbi:MAG: hypothetical protein ACRC2H_00990 [Silanimonas sp.]